MTLPDKYRKDPPFIVTYDFVDIIRNNGYIKLYGTSSYEGATPTQKYLLISEQSSAHWQTTSANRTYLTEGDGVGAGSFNKVIDIDFDVEVNTTFTIKGLGIVNVTSEISHSSSQPSMYLYAKLRKWDGSTETEIASSRTPEQGGTGTTYIRASLMLDVPETVIKKGETLRLTIEGYSDADVGEKLQIYHDPKSKNTVTIDTKEHNTDLIFQLPLKVPN